MESGSEKQSFARVVSGEVVLVDLVLSHPLASLLGFHFLMYLEAGWAVILFELGTEVSGFDVIGAILTNALKKNITQSIYISKNEIVQLYNHRWTLFDKNACLIPWLFDAMWFAIAIWVLAME